MIKKYKISEGEPLLKLRLLIWVRVTAIVDIIYNFDY